MGSTKDSLKPTTSTGKNLFDKLATRFKGKKKETPKNVADQLVELESKILLMTAGINSDKNYLEETSELIEKVLRGVDKLITTKESELENEKGREDYNARTAARLKVMEFNLNELAQVFEALQSATKNKKNIDKNDFENYKKFANFLVAETIERAAAIGADN